MHRPLIIAIDGPSASGKSTLGRLLARELKLLYIDTGSMYRAVALAAIEAKLDPRDHEAVAALAHQIKIDLAGEPDSLHVLLDGRDVSARIRAEDVTEISSIVSTIPAVRRRMVERQRELGRRGAVMNGRDIGTVVFPDADLKIFLTATARERAKRRLAEELEKGNEVNYEQTLADINARDTRDMTRADSPLVAANDAIQIDSNGKSIREVLDEMMRIAKNLRPDEDSKIHL